jgi:hypothetical protein
MQNADPSSGYAFDVNLSLHQRHEAAEDGQKESDALGVARQRKI